MPNLTSKKTKTINSSSLIKNQISNILQPVNGTVNLNVQKTNTISTQSAASQSYYIPLLEKITGEQSINVKVHLSFNATTNTLSVPNLTISNLPTCNVNASNSSNSSDLVNKSYVNTYAYFDLSGGDRWYCEDWIGKIYTDTNSNTKIKATFNWNITNSIRYTVYKTIPVAPNHIGVLQLQCSTDSQRMLSLPVSYQSTKVKSIRFIVKVDSADTNSILFLGFSDGNINSANDCSIRVGDNAIKLMVNNTLKQTYNIASNPYSTVPNNWVLYEITLSNNFPTFYIKNLTTNTPIANYTSNTTMPSFAGYIYLFNSNKSIIDIRNVYIDYIDWVVSS
jgi:hypothetical protein